MASSTGEEPPTSSIVGNAPLVTMEAKMIVATGREQCQQLKDGLSKEDPSTMVVVMASCNQDPKPPKPRSPAMDYRLQAAACSGSWQELQSFLNAQDRQTSSDGAIRSSAMQSAFGDEEALLRESFLDGVTTEGDTFLHVMATNGDGEKLDEDGPIRRKAVSLLFEKNNNEDTPLHCAARAAKFQMVSFLIDLARVKDYNVNTVRALLRKENKSKWTVLHEAVRSGNNDIVKLLMTHDQQLASFPKDDTSPLYLAILLENKIIAETVYELSGGKSGSNGGNLSYSGPNGQNALHAAVLRGKDLTKMMIGWNDKLALQQDVNGSTPLHVATAARLGKRDRLDMLSQVLEANPDALYQRDYDGSFPIHVAAFVSARMAITNFLKKSPNCAGLRDASGRTFLHVAAHKMKICIVKDACRNRSLSWILNMQDNDGNTALHLAIQTESVRLFCVLIETSQVHMSLTNKKGETPLDIAHHNLPRGLYDKSNSKAKIHSALEFFGAKRGIGHGDYIKENDIVEGRHNEIYEMEQVKEGTQSQCIGSVLIATMTFGAAFAIPGGYRADDHTNGGTPTLVGSKEFTTFTVANTLAFVSSALATIFLMSSGSPLQHLRTRKFHLRMAMELMSVSVTSLVGAFSLGTNMILAPVASKTANAVVIMSLFILSYKYVEMIVNNIIMARGLIRRKGIVLAILSSQYFLLCDLIYLYWPLIFVYSLATIEYIVKVEPSAQPPASST